MDPQTIDAYNKMAMEYDKETVDFWEKFPSGFLERFAKLAGGKVLDIGSGPGRDALLLLEYDIEPTCLDASRAMIDITQAKGLTSVLADFAEMPFADGVFDGIWAYTSLLHVTKREMSEVFLEIRRVLKPGGILGLGLIEGEGEEYKTSSGMDAPRLFSFYTKSEIESILENHGFDILHFEQFTPRSKNYLNFIAKLSGK